MAPSSLGDDAVSCVGDDDSMSYVSSSWSHPPPLVVPLTKADIEAEIHEHSAKLATLHISAYKRSLLRSEADSPLAGWGAGHDDKHTVTSVNVERFVSEYTSAVDAGLDDGIMTLDKHVRRTGGAVGRSPDSDLVTTGARSFDDWMRLPSCPRSPSAESAPLRPPPSVAPTLTSVTTVSEESSELGSGGDEVAALRAQLAAVMRSREDIRRERDMLELRVAQLEAMVARPPRRA